MSAGTGGTPGGDETGTALPDADGGMSAGDVPARAIATGAQVLDAMLARAGGPELLALGRAGGGDIALVGGAVRDLLLGRSPRELDVVVNECAALLADELSASVRTATGADASVTAHERFGTAVVEWAAGRVDIAERRAESYPGPGALPQVRPGSAEEDLQRRDFTVNAIAVPLGGPHEGELLCAPGALEDLAASRLSVLHDRSFLDDPTRLLRLARYSARLGFQPDPHTAALAAQALEAGALNTISLARVGAELRLALAETDPVAAFAALEDVGVFAALERRLRFDRDLARCALALLPEDGRADLLLLASLLLPVAVDPDEDPEPVMFELLDGWEFTAAERERTMRTALVAPSLDTEMELAELPSELHDALFAHTIEAVALGGALGNAASAAREWIQTLRHVDLAITGADLISAGIPTGPEIGRRLATVLARKLDGELRDGRDAELRAAMEERA
jgi:tRNA nucleotidyltransferase (CCA-adding enzyme)